VAKNIDCPSPEELDLVMKKLNQIEGTLSLSENPTSIEKFRWDLCQQFIKLVRVQKLKQVDLGKMLKINKSEVNKILHHRNEK